METKSFYERPEVFHEVIESKRSDICHKLITEVIRRTEKNNIRILDVGCGDGSFISRFRNCCEVFGVDISENALRIAEKNEVNVHRLNLSCERLPFGKSYFDVVYVGDVIEHLLDPDFTIREVRRVIHPQGSLVLSTPNLASWLNRLLLLLGNQPLFSEVSTSKIFGRPGSIPVGHLRLFTYKALLEFLKFYGFKLTKVVGAPFEMLPGSIGKIDSCISRIPSISSIIIVVARTTIQNGH